jgi:hypothetical protein
MLIFGSVRQVPFGVRTLRDEISTFEVDEVPSGSNSFWTPTPGRLCIIGAFAPRYTCQGKDSWTIVSIGSATGAILKACAP